MARHAGRALGLKRTLFPTIKSNALPEPYTRGYMDGNNVIAMDSPALPESMQAAARAGKLAPVDQTNANASWTGASPRLPMGAIRPRPSPDP